MFDAVSERFQKIFRDLRGMGKITEKNINEPMREIRKARMDRATNIRCTQGFGIVDSPF